MKKIFIILFISLCSSSIAQTISDAKHNIMYFVSYEKDDGAYLVRDKNKHLVYYFTISLMFDKNQKDICQIRDNGDISPASYDDTIGNSVLGNIGEQKITNKDGKVIGGIFRDFGYCTDENKKIIAYFDENVPKKLVALLIYFYTPK